MIAYDKAAARGYYEVWATKANQKHAHVRVWDQALLAGMPAAACLPAPGALAPWKLPLTLQHRFAKWNTERAAGEVRSAGACIWAGLQESLEERIGSCVKAACILPGNLQR